MIDLEKKMSEFIRNVKEYLCKCQRPQIKKRFIKEVSQGIEYFTVQNYAMYTKGERVKIRDLRIPGAAIVIREEVT